MRAFSGWLRHVRWQRFGPALMIWIFLLQPVALGRSFNVPPAQAASPAQSEAPAAAPLNALLLNGTNGYVRVPYSSELNSLSAITIEAWVWRNQTNRNETLVGNSWTESYWLGFSPTGKLRFIPHGTGSIVDSNATVGAGKWTHVAVTYNGTTRNYYINGLLDKTSTSLSGPITGNSGDPLGIGFDVDPFTGNYFDGIIDEVRLWNVARSPADIQSNLFQVFSAPLPTNLVAYWRLNGNAADETGDHDGSVQGGLGSSAWVTDGGIPKDIRIPQLSVSPVLDGLCSASEYGTAPTVSVNGVEVALLHTATHLWACFDFYVSSNYDRALLFLDLNHDRQDPAQPDDARFIVTNGNELIAEAGDGLGGWVPTTAYDGLWDGEYHVTGGEFPLYTAELRLDASITGGWSHVVGLALGTDILRVLGIEMWPALAEANLPSTWSAATLGGISPPRTFSGRVEYQPKNPSYDPTPVGGAKVELIGYDPGGSEALVASGSTGPGGGFSLTSDDDYTQHRLELTQLPPGYMAVAAEAPAPGAALDARTLDYGSAGPGSYPDNIFTLADVAPANLDAPYGPVYLIVAPFDVIQAGALDDFMAFKRGQGFAIGAVSLETVDATYSGATRLERIRALEKSYLTTYGDRFKFVLLVGPDSAIPYARLTIGATGASGTVCPNPDNVNFKYSDWMYVDLQSNFDSNGNGCYADGIRTKPGDKVGGYVADSGILFKADVALGRIPFDEPNTVRNILKNSAGFEKQSEAYKQRVLLGMSMLALKGYFYGQVCSNNWGDHCVPPSDNASANYDLTLLGEAMQNDYLDLNGFTSTYFYENEEAVAGGQGIHSPEVLSEQAIIDALNARMYGLVDLAGHGNSAGVYRDYWLSDKNSNGVVDIRDDSQTEAGGGAQLQNDSLAHIDPDFSRGAIFLLVSCNTASPANEGNLAATLLAEGYGIASVGGLNIITVGNWLNPNSGLATSDNYYIVRRLLHRSYSLGQAFWWTLSDRIHKGDGGSGNIGEGLFGDPSLTFWGNPGGQASQAAWAMGRRDPAGASYLTLPGPTVPVKRWEYTANPMGLPTLPPAPLVSNNGEVIVASGTQAQILRQGAVYQTLALDAAVFGSPALSADGTLYVLDVNAKLYAFPYKRLTFGGFTWMLDERYRRWTLDLGETPQTSPVVGADGFISTAIGGTTTQLWLVRPDGVAYSSLLMAGHALNFSATGADRVVYAATTDFDNGYLYRFELFCDTFIYPDVCPNATFNTLVNAEPFNTAPLLAYGSLYVGDVDGTLYKINRTTLQIEATFTADGAIRNGPIATPGGAVAFLTINGTFYSLTSGNLSLRWQKGLGSTSIYSLPAASSDAIYLVFDDHLRAYNPNSGALLWQRYLGSNVGAGSASVGYGREVYLQTLTGLVRAYGETWGLNPARILALPQLLGARQVIRVDWLQSLPPISGTLQTDVADDLILAPSAAALSAVLLQRSAGGGPWEDLAILPAGTLVYTDTQISPDTSYAYRVQNLSSGESGSDFTATLEVVQSYPDLPGAPALGPIQSLAADALGLEWSAPAGSVVDRYRIERSDQAAGPFTPVITVTVASQAYLDVGLAAATPYYYRVVALNSAGASPPSNVQGGQTRTPDLAAPQNLQAHLLPDGWIELTWDPGPPGASAEIELLAFGMSSFALQAVVPADGTYLYLPQEPNAYDFRVKFVLGASESPYATTVQSVVVLPLQLVNLPVVIR
jgi:hypothetical protein